MALRELTAKDLSTIDWKDAGDGWFQILADVTCARCGAYQAADCDPTRNRQTALDLAVRLFNHVGWRIDEHDRLHCPDCAGK